MFETMELQAPVFFLLHSLVRAGGFTDVDPPICARCLRWNLVAPFSKCNRNGWDGCGRCTYIQHARCKDVGSQTLPGPCPTANRDRCRRSFCRPSLCSGITSTWWRVLVLLVVVRSFPACLHPSMRWCRPLTHTIRRISACLGAADAASRRQRRRRRSDALPTSTTW